jgi:hypothetical protein
MSEYRGNLLELEGLVNAKGVAGPQKGRRADRGRKIWDCGFWIAGEIVIITPVPNLPLLQAPA